MMKVYYQLNREKMEYVTRTLNIFGSGCEGCSRRRGGLPEEGTEWGACNYEGITHSECPFDYINNTLAHPGPEWVEVAS